jgi:hypothetical protein
VIERGLHDLAVVLDRRVGVVEELERRNSESTSRDEAAPIAEASRCSA